MTTLKIYVAFIKVYRSQKSGLHSDAESTGDRADEIDNQIILQLLTVQYFRTHYDSAFMTLMWELHTRTRVLEMTTTNWNMCIEVTTDFVCKELSS